MNYKLVLALLFSAPLFAADFNQDQGELAAAQRRIDEADARVKSLHAGIGSSHQKASSLAGKHEHRGAITAHTNAARSKMDQHASACKDLIAAHKNLEVVIAKVSGPDRQVESLDGKYTLVKREDKSEKPEPVRMPMQARTSKAYRTH